jgi:Polysaccharide biosynthesis protein.
MKNSEEQSTLKRLSENFISLVALQFINIILPLLLIPYLIRVLGIEGFGVYSFVLAIILYGVKLSDYGFTLSATYHISLNQKNKLKINEVFSSVLTIKVLIVLAYIILLTPLVF